MSSWFLDALSFDFDKFKEEAEKAIERHPRRGLSSATPTNERAATEREYRAALLRLAE